MAGFETRAIWGSDPGLVSDRFRYTGVSVPPLDENLVDDFNRNFQQRFSLLQNAGESVDTKKVANFAWNQAVKEQHQPQAVDYPALSELQSFNPQVPAQKFLESTINPFEKTPLPFLGSLATNQLNLSGENPFKAAAAKAHEDWIKRKDAGLSSGTAFDRLVDAQDRGLDWYAMKQGAIPPGRIGAPKGFAPGDVFSDGFQNTASRKAFEQAVNAQAKQGLNPDQIAKNLFPNKTLPKWYRDPALFQNLLSGLPQAAGKAVKQTGTLVADALFPGRHNVPERLAAAIESPGFSDAAQQRAFFDALPTESIAPGEISTKESRWLLDPRRTPVVGAGMYGAVVVPTNLNSAFKIQSGNPKEFYQNEVDMALRTAELGYGPKVESLTLQPIDKTNLPGASLLGNKELHRAVTRTEAVPHRKFNELSEPEQKFLNLERFKVTEGLIRGGVLNKDNHTGNILLNDVTKQPVQVDSGLAREYDPLNVVHLYDRLSNIEYGLKSAGLNEIADTTRQIGGGLLDELSRNPSPELYAEAENFFNRSGNILLKTPNEYPGLPKQTLIESVSSAAGMSQPLAGRLRAGIRGAAGVGALDLIPSKEAVNRFTNEGLLGGASQMAQEYAAGIPMALAMGAGTTLVPAIGTAVAPALAGGALIKGGEAVNQAYLNATGKNFPTRNVVGQQGAVYTGPTPTIKPRTGTAILGGKPIQVPYGSVAGVKKVGRPWWDQTGSRIQQFADLLNRGSIFGR
jgi:hypothetical protein